MPRSHTRPPPPSSLPFRLHLLAPIPFSALGPPVQGGPLPLERRSRQPGAAAQGSLRAPSPDPRGVQCSDPRVEREKSGPGRWGPFGQVSQVLRSPPSCAHTVLGARFQCSLVHPPPAPPSRVNPSYPDALSDLCAPVVRWRPPHSHMGLITGLSAVLFSHLGLSGENY